MKRGSAPVNYGSKRIRGGEDDFEDFDEDLLMDDGEVMQNCVLEYDEEAEVRRWARASEDVATYSDGLAFQWLDIDIVSGEPLIANPDGGGKRVGSVQGPVPIIRLYGVTAKGTSVLACVHGFTPYFFASIPASVELNVANLSAIRGVLDQRMHDKARGEEKKITSFVLGVEREANKQSLLGYHFGATRDFIKVYCAMPSLVPGLKRLFDEGFQVPGIGNITGQTYESNVPFILRFMIDNSINGSDWLELPAGTFSVRDKKDHVSRCSVEVDVTFNHVHAHAPEGAWSSIAPMRILSFDIECQGRKGHFPEAQLDPVIQIANTVTLQGSDTPIIKNVFTLNTCLPIVGAQVICSATEEEMLLKWREFVNSVDPDILTGYNISNFDIPYLLNRAKTLEKKNMQLKRFADLGRVKGMMSVMKETTFQSSAVCVLPPPPMTA